MKIRRFLLLFHVCFLGAFAILLVKMNQITYRAVDLGELNGRMMSVTEGLDAGESIVELEQQYACNIFQLSDSDYMTQLYHSYSNGDTIFDYMTDGQLTAKIVFERKDDTFQRTKRRLMSFAIGLILFSVVLVDGVMLFLYLRILKPFQKMQTFAHRIAVGNLDAPLLMDKHNYFGAFTESFDIMRTELKAAKEGEMQANRSKKELVASLSHDIKTPVATIKALCEVLEIKLQGNDQQGKIHTIEKKADLIDQLISNLFHATLSELETLKINPKPEPSTLLLEMFQEMDSYGEIHLLNEIPSCLIVCDSLRLNQVIDNILMNSYKYANTRIDVTFRENATELLVQIRDYGEGVKKEDLALICEKFYRGENSQGKSGSGLGLFLATQFMNGMQGSLECETEHGFVVTLTLKKA